MILINQVFCDVIDVARAPSHQMQRVDTGALGKQSADHMFATREVKGHDVRPSKALDRPCGPNPDAVPPVDRPDLVTFTVDCCNQTVNARLLDRRAIGELSGPVEGGRPGTARRGVGESAVGRTAVRRNRLVVFSLDRNRLAVYRQPPLQPQCCDERACARSEREQPVIPPAVRGRHTEGPVGGEFDPVDAGVVTEVGRQLVGPALQGNDLRRLGDAQGRRVEVPDRPLIDRPALWADARDRQRIESGGGKIRDDADRIPDAASGRRIEGHAKWRADGSSTTNTEPVLRLNLEANDREKMERERDRILARVDELGR